MSRRLTLSVPAGQSVEELAKTACLQGLLGAAGTADPYVVRQHRVAIEAALAAEGRPASDLRSFHAAAVDLARQTSPVEPSFGFALLELHGPADLDPLFLRQRLVASLRGLSGHEHGLLAVTGLRRACAAGPARGRRLRLDDLRRQLHDWVGRYAPRHTALTFLCA